MGVGTALALVIAVPFGIIQAVRRNKVADYVGTAVSFLFYASALEAGSVTVATAAVVLAETLPPSAVGVVFLGDRTRPGMGGIAIAGFVLAVCCAVALARFGEAHHDDDRTGPDGEPITQMAGKAGA